MTDRNFDDLAERLARNIYATDKGRLRLTQLQHILAPLRNGPPLKVLDAGCGLGQMSAWMAAGGHEVTACDISATMLERTLAACAEQGHAVECLQTSLHELPPRLQGQFDLVICHAVLEWLDDPQAAITLLERLLRPGGWLSLMFFNRQALEFGHLMVGNFTRVFEGDIAGDGRNLLPTGPLDQYAVEEWLTGLGLRIHARAGIRVVRDYLLPRVRERLDFDQLLQAERRFMDVEPFCRLGRYIHLLCQAQA